MCLVSFILIIILLYIILFQFNIIIHTHVSPGWLLLISVFLFFFLIFLKRELVLFVGFSFAYFPYFFTLRCPFCLICICGSLALPFAASSFSFFPYCFIFYQLLLLFASGSGFVAAACALPPFPFLLERKSRKKTGVDPLCSAHTIIRARVAPLPSGWRSSAGWTASPGPRTVRRRWLRRSPECTSCGSAASAGPTCR